MRVLDAIMLNFMLVFGIGALDQAFGLFKPRSFSQFLMGVWGLATILSPVGYIFWWSFM